MGALTPAPELAPVGADAAAEDAISGRGAITRSWRQLRLASPRPAVRTPSGIYPYGRRRRPTRADELMRSQQYPAAADAAHRQRAEAGCRGD